MAIEDLKSAVSVYNARLASTRIRLSPDQQRQIARQLDFHDGGPFHDNIHLDRVLPLRVAPGVMRPMSSKALAHWIWANPGVVRNRVVFDIGTGCGLQAIVSAVSGARKVVSSDLTDHAVACATENIRHLGLTNLIEVRQSDLFSEFKANELADVLIFAQPFFGDEPIPERPVSIGMLDPGLLVPRFLRDAKTFLSPEGLLLMMAWSFAGPTNDPRTYFREAHYNCVTVGEEVVTAGCQQGRMELLALYPVGAREPEALRSVLGTALNRG